MSLNRSVAIIASMDWMRSFGSFASIFERQARAFGDIQLGNGGGFVTIASYSSLTLPLLGKGACGVKCGW